MPSLFNTVAQILAAGEDLVPWIEERAFQYSMYRFALPARVLNYGDMRGWNTRKVSLTYAPGMAAAGSENTALTETSLVRKRLATIAPSEWGHVYYISDRRLATDPEDPAAEIVKNLGYSLGLKREQLLYNALLASPGPNTSVSGAYTLGAALNVASVFRANAIEDQLFHVIHTYQFLDIMTELIDLSKPAVPEFRNRFLQSWDFGGFDGLNIAVSNLVPRNVTHKLNFTGSTTGNFQLWVNGYATGNIAYSATAATLVSNINTALDAIADGLDWSATASGTNINDIEITYPSTLYVMHPEELRLNRDTDGDDVADAGVTVSILERSAIARAPIWSRSAVVHDRREPIRVNLDTLYQGRTLEVGGYETYGVGAWRQDYGGYIQTDATAPNAVT